MNQEEMQQKYLMMQVLKQQLQNMIEQKNALDERIEEVQSTIEAVKDLKKLKKGGEMWSTLGSGAFVRSDIKDIENVLVAVGAGVVLSKKQPEAAEILQKRMDEYKGIDEEIVQEINKVASRAQEVEGELERMAREMQGQSEQPEAGG